MKEQGASFMCQTSQISIRKLILTHGRIRLELDAFWQGEDLQVMLYGGEPHIGAVALASLGSGALLIVLPGHREGPLAREMAESLAQALNCKVCVTCGIHYNEINQQEIGLVLGCADELCQKLIEGITKW